MTKIGWVLNVKTCNVKSNKLPMADLGLDQAQKENYQVHTRLRPENPWGGRTRKAEFFG